MPFGVELPDNIGSATAAPEGAAAPVSSPEGAAPEGATVSTEALKPEIPGKSVTPTLTDLDKLERFRFSGREWTRKELQDAHLRHEDYTRKTQEVAEARKFADNFAVDLRTVLTDRKRFEEFKRIYPREYVAAAEKILGQLPGQPAPGPSTTQQTDPKIADELSQMRSELGQFKQATEQAQVEQIQSWLDNQFESLTKKYPYADTEVINARAEIAARSGTQITAEVLDKLFKQHDEQVKSRWEGMYKTKVNQQLTAGKRGKDMGPGGGTPSGEPKKFKTIKEATKGFLDDIAANR